MSLRLPLPFHCSCCCRVHAAAGNRGMLLLWRCDGAYTNVCCSELHALSSVSTEEAAVKGALLLCLEDRAHQGRRATSSSSTSAVAVILQQHYCCWRRPFCCCCCCFCRVKKDRVTGSQIGDFCCFGERVNAKEEGRTLPWRPWLQIRLLLLLRVESSTGLCSHSCSERGPLLLLLQPHD